MLMKNSHSRLCTPKSLPCRAAIPLLARSQPRSPAEPLTTPRPCRHGYHGQSFRSLPVFLGLAQSLVFLFGFFGKQIWSCVDAMLRYTRLRRLLPPDRQRYGMHDHMASQSLILVNLILISCNNHLFLGGLKRGETL